MKRTGTEDRIVGPYQHFKQIDAGLAYHITVTLASFHWLKVPERVQFKLATIVYRSLNGTAPHYLAADLRRLSDRRRPDDVCGHHSPIISMSASRSVHLFNCWRPVVC